MLIDTHCHISGDDYDDIDKIIEDDFKEVDKIIISGCSKKDIIESLDIAEKNENMFKDCGTTELKIYVPESIYSNRKTFK